MNRVLPLFIGGVAAVILVLIVSLLSSQPTLKPISRAQSYDPATLNGNLTDAQLIEKANREPLVKLFVNKYPNAQVHIQHSQEMMHMPPLNRVWYTEDRYIVGDQDGVFRSFSATAVFNINDNATALVNIDCRYLSYYVAPNPAIITVDDATDFILNEKCFASPPPSKS